MVELVLQNLHRMQELAVELSARDFARLFALPAQALNTFCCTADSAACTLPVRWEAPLLLKLELGVVYVPADAQPLPSAEFFSVYALHGLLRPLSELFPALRSVCMAAATPDVVHDLRDLPQMLTELTRWTSDAHAIDYAPRGHGFALLRLELARYAAPVLDLFVITVAGAREMTVGRKGWRLGLLAEREDVTFDVDLASPFSFAREPRIGQHFARMSAMSVDATLLVQMAASACSLLALRRLALEYTSRPEWPSGEPAPIRVPQLEEVSLRLDTEADGAGVWVAEAFPEMLQSLSFDRPLLARISIEADWDAAQELEERNIAEIRALTECLRVGVVGEPRECDHQRG